MTMHPLAQPFAREAKPDLTGDRSIGVLLLHGFTGSPASLRPWANHLAGHGYAVEVPLLPGHGTRWQDCNLVTEEDRDAVARGWRLAGRVSRKWDEQPLFGPAA